MKILLGEYSLRAPGRRGGMAVRRVIVEVVL